MMPQTVRNIYFGFISDFALKIILGLQRQSSLQRMVLQNFTTYSESIYQINKGHHSGSLKVIFHILLCKLLRNSFFYLGMRLVQPPKGYQQSLWVTGFSVLICTSKHQFVVKRNQRPIQSPFYLIGDSFWTMQSLNVACAHCQLS